MKHSLLRRTLGLLLAAAMLLTLLPATALAGNADVVIAAWEHNETIESSSSVSATTGTGKLTHSDADSISVSTTGQYTHKSWSTEKYWLLSGIDTTGFINLSLSFRAAGSGTGPANWVLEYSADLGESWAEAGSYTLLGAGNYVCDGIALPDDAICESLCLRLRPKDAVSISGGTVGGAGTNKLSFIRLVGIPDGYQTLAKFNFTEAVVLPVAAASGYGYLTSTVTAAPSYATEALTAENWQEDDYWLMVFNTSGCTDIKLTAYLKSSGTGPRTFVAEYSVNNGTSWEPISGYSLTNSSLKQFSFTLPDAAQSPNLLVRLRVNSSESVNGGSVGKRGNSKINNIELTAKVGEGRVDNPAAPTYPSGFTTGGNETGGDNDLPKNAIAGWQFDDAVALPCKAHVGYGYLANSVTTNPEYTGGAISVKRWQLGSYWLLAVNTTGYSDMKLTAKLMGTSTAPRDFILQYSLDNGAAWTDIQAVTVTAALFEYSFDLPDEAQSVNCLLRFVVTGTDAVSSTVEQPKEIGASGAGKINYVVLTGTLSGTHEANPTAPTYPADYDPSLLDPSAGGATVVGDALAHWEFTEAANLPAAATSGWGTLTHSSSVFTVFTSEALSQTGWVAGSYWQFVANTSDCTEMTIKLKIASTNTGPRNISLRYSKDLGQTWIEFATLSLTTSLKFYALTIPDAAQSENLVIRLVASDNEAINGSNIKNGGNNKINQITISGIVGSNHAANPAEVTYPADWSVSSDYDASSVYVPTPDAASSVSSGFTAGERRMIAQWGGNANYEGALVVYGDLVGANDRLDGAAELTTVVLNETVTPGFSTASTNSTNYYMGSKTPCIGSGYLIPEGVDPADYEIDENTVWTDDYIQLKVSTAKFTDLELSLRLRVSSKGPQELSVKYSHDGENWSSFTTGHYDYAYTGYGYGGATYDVSDEGEIAGGVIPVPVQGNYINVRLDVPQGAENRETLYIRFIASHKACTATDAGDYVTKNASLRMDTIELTGCPMAHPQICEPVSVDMQGSVPAGQQLTFTTATEDAVILYSLDCGKTVSVYDSENKPVLSVFPALFKVWAEKDGMDSSVKTYFRYTQAQVGSVKAKPNGGAVSEDTEVRLSCATQDAELRYSFDNGTSWQTYLDTDKPVLSAALLENGCTMMVMGVKDGYLNSPVSVLSFTRRLNSKYNLYFGQMHSHTNYSDGAGSCEEAFQHAVNVENLDFLAVTDHSNAFDNDLLASISDGSMSSKWVSGHELADKYTTDDSFVCLYGYEMTWSNGLGHMNTYNSAGFQSRTQSDFSSYSTALQKYYDALLSDTNTISQFNHPGTTFGDFQDYAYFDPEIDELITMIEVGNGEGAIGSSGYFPSYEEYTRALDLGWHVAPTNNQDNHRGNWGDSNTARTVIMADSLTRNNIYDAIRNRRIYATEDNDLNLYFTLDGYEMGTILTEEDVSDTLELQLELSDATDRGNCKVEVIANGGMVVRSVSANTASDTVSLQLPPDYSYYFFRITQADGDIAVTAPVWIGEVESVGVSALSADTDIPVQGETLNLTAELFNNEDSDLSVQSIDFLINDEVIHSVSLATAGLTVLAHNSTASYSFPFTYNGIGDVTVQVRVMGVFEGAQKKYQGDLQLSYLPASLITEVLIDGTHYNDYVTGYSEGNVTKLATLGADQFARVTIVRDAFTPQMLKSCDLLVITAPAKRTLETYKTSHFSDSFMTMVSDYVNAGGSVVVCGLADYQDSTACQTHTEVNKLLTRIGSSMRLNSDELAELDDDGQPVYALELTRYNQASKWLAGAGDALPYTTYSACSVVLPAADPTVEALIYGNEATFSVDTKSDTGYTINREELTYVVQPGQVVAAAVQTTEAGGHIFLSGGVFLSDYDLLNDNNEQKVNAVLLSNILEANAASLPVSPISEMRKGETGDVFCIEGYVTAGTENEYNKFFDTIYIQDATGGVTIYPFSDLGLALGTKLRITGYVDSYQDDLELQVLKYKVLDETHLVSPTKLSCKDAMDYAKNGGKLVETTGVVIDVDLLGSTVSQLRLLDGNGGIATVFIDGYIYSGTTGKNELASFCKPGAVVSAVGLCFMHPETGEETSSCCLRVRNCDEIKLSGDDCMPNCPSEKFTDLKTGTCWYHPGVDYALATGIMNGEGNGKFNPDGRLTRAMMVTMLYRVENTPSVQSQSNPFTDVPNGKWYTDAVIWAAGKGIVTGTSATSFAPNSPITREQIATILFRYSGAQEVSVDLSGYPDYNRISNFAKNAMCWANSEGIIRGTTAGNQTILNPLGNATRAEVATMLFRYLMK